MMWNARGQTRWLWLSSSGFLICESVLAKSIPLMNFASDLSFLLIILSSPSLVQQFKSVPFIWKCTANVQDYVILILTCFLGFFSVQKNMPNVVLQTSVTKEYTGDTALKRSLNSKIYLLTFLSRESPIWYFILLKGSHTLISLLIHNFPSLIQIYWN